MRYCRIDNYENGDIITLGEDRWMLLPIYKRDDAEKLGGIPDSTPTTGTLARWPTRSSTTGRKT